MWPNSGNKKNKKSVIEDDIEAQNRSEWNELMTNIKGMRMVADGIHGHLKNDKDLVDDVTKAFEKNKSLLGKLSSSL